MEQPEYKTIGQELQMASFTDDYQKAYLNLTFTANYLSLPINKALKQFDLTSSQYNVLRILRGQRSKPISVMDIQSRMIYPTSNVSRILDKLISKKLIESEACNEDRRKNNIRITPAGMELLDKTDPIPLRIFNQMQQAITPEEAAVINNLLDKLRSGTASSDQNL